MLPIWKTDYFFLLFKITILCIPLIPFNKRLNLFIDCKVKKFNSKTEGKRGKTRTVRMVNSNFIIHVSHNKII